MIKLSDYRKIYGRGQSIMKIILLILTISFLSACASLDKGECEAANWYQYGQNDGIKGSKSRETSHTKACAKHNIRFNKDEYFKGYNNGLTVFCTFDRGFETINNGYAMHMVCDASKVYVDGYIAGAQKYCTFENGVDAGKRGGGHPSHCATINNGEFSHGYGPGYSIYKVKKTISDNERWIDGLQETLESDKSSDRKKFNALLTIRSYNRNIEKAKRQLTIEERSLKIATLDHEVADIDSDLRIQGLSYENKNALQRRRELLRLERNTLNTINKTKGIKNTVDDLKELRDSLK